MHTLLLGKKYPSTKYKAKLIIAMDVVTANIMSHIVTFHCSHMVGHKVQLGQLGVGLQA